MPIRRIPLGRRSVTGLVATDRQHAVGVESSLERDFVLLMNFDESVENVEEQPVSIPYTDSGGRKRSYTPDVLVRFRKGSDSPRKRPLLCEVKYRNDLRESWDIIKPKLRAANGFARRRGWTFRVFTEREIRTPYLANVKFLRQYRSLPVGQAHYELLTYALRNLRETDPQTLMAAVYEDKWNQAELLPSLWHLVATREIATDLTLPLTMRSRIWLGEP